MTHTLVLVFAILAGAWPARAQESSPPASTPAASAPLTFSVTYDASVCAAFTGRVYVMLGAGPGEPRRGPHWTSPQPFYGVDVRDWKPGEPLVFDDRAIAFPHVLSALPDKEWAVQAVMRRNLDSPSIGDGEGTAYSHTVRRRLNGRAGGEVSLLIDQVVPPKSLRETERIKVLQMKSEMLSYFHARPITMSAVVILPKGYDQSSDRRYPVLYWIGGFGADGGEAYSMAGPWDHTGFDGRIVRVVLDPSCFGGHHVFTDSANNGPRGRALVEELIPELERRFRLVAAPTARFLSGHSSGGWSSLWLQVTYPETFGGVWSVAPDPVTFSNFQNINLYAPGANMYRDGDGQRRPLMRREDEVLIWYEDFARMEVPYGEGGQLRSFEWVFSPRGEDGLPRPLFDRDTGAVNSAVAESWKKYDIRLLIEDSWDALSSKLAGKIHISIGAEDNFYLEGAVRDLKESLGRLGSDAVIEIVPDRDHGTIASPQLRRRIDQELLAIFDAHHLQYANPSRAYD